MMGLVLLDDAILLVMSTTIVFGSWQDLLMTWIPSFRKESISVGSFDCSCEYPHFGTLKLFFVAFFITCALMFLIGVK